MSGRDGFAIEAAISYGSPQPSSSSEPTKQTAEALGLLDCGPVRHPLPDCGLAGGEGGTIVEIVDQPDRAYLVDFSGGSADPTQRLPAPLVESPSCHRPLTGKPRRAARRP